MRKREHICYRLLPWLLWMAVIFYFSSQSGDQVSAWLRALVEPIIPAYAPNAGVIKFSVQKSAHLIEYAVLAILCWRAVQPLWARRAFRLSLLLSLAFAVSDEWHQSFVPGRGPSWRDVGIDGLGILFGLLVMHWIGFALGRLCRDTSAD
ncbi:MAG: VanZ family protein [Bacillota bacterium]